MISKMKWALGVSALCSVALAPSAYAVAVATFSAATNISMSAVADPGVSVTGVASIFNLAATGNATAVSVISAAPGDDLLAGALTVNASASGSASAPPTSTASATSEHDVVIDIVNTGAVAATATLTFTWDQLVSAATNAMAAIASAGSDLLFTEVNGGALPVIDSFITAIAGGVPGGSSQTVAVAPTTLSVTYTLDPGAGLSLMGVFGFVDAFGDALAVPEPTTGLLLLAGLAGLGYARRRSLHA